jgi:hypothetical protein
MAEMTPEQAAAALPAAYERRRRLKERMQSGIIQVTNADGSGVRYETATERAKALAIADADIQHLEMLAGQRRRVARRFVFTSTKGF